MGSNDRDINLAIIGEDFTKPATDGAARNFDNLQKKVDGFKTDKPVAEVDKFKGKVKDTEKEVDQLTKLLQAQSKDGETAFAALGRAIDVQKTKLIELRKTAKNNTGATSIFGDIKNTASDLKKLTDLAESVGLDFSEEGIKAGTSFVEGLTSKISDAGPLIPVAIGAGAGVAAALTQIVAGAVGVGVSAGFIAGGVLALRNDGGVQNVMDQLKADVSSTFTEAAAPLAGPLIDGIRELDGLVVGLKPDLSAAFAAVGPDIKPLVDGIGGLVAEALPEFVDALRSAEPVVAALGADLPKFGKSIGDMVDDISRSPGAIQGMDDAFKLLDVTVVAAGAAVSTTSTLWGLLTDPVGLVTNEIADAHARQDAWNTSVSYATTIVSPYVNTVGELSDAYAAANIEAGKLLITENDLFGKNMSLDQANLAVAAGADALSAAIKRNGDHWDITTPKGRDNTQMLEDQIGKLHDQFQAQVDLTGDTPKVVAAYDKSIDKLLAQARAAGDSAAAVEALRVKYELLFAGLNALNGKKFTYTVHESFTGSTIGSGRAGVMNSDNATFSDSPSWNPFPAGAAPAATMAPREVNVTTSSTLVVDGREMAAVVTYHTAADRAHERHVARVGRR